MHGQGAGSHLLEMSARVVHKRSTFDHWYFVAVIVAVIPVIYAVEGNGRLNHYAAHHLFRRVQYMNKVTSGKIRDLTLTCDLRILLIIEYRRYN